MKTYVKICTKKNCNSFGIEKPIEHTTQEEAEQGKWAAGDVFCKFCGGSNQIIEK
jgi:hypothetical protein